MQQAEFFNAVTNKFAGYPIYSFHLDKFLENIKNADLEEKLGNVVNEFNKEYSDFSIKVEVFLHPDYRNKELNANLLLACVPVYNDSFLTMIPAFDMNGNESEINAWVFPDDKIILALRIDEMVDRNQDYETKEQDEAKNVSILMENKKSLQRIQSSSYFYVHLDALQWNDTQKGEPDAMWPPEYYTKTWYCNNSNCTSFSGYKRRNMDNPLEWEPELENTGDMDKHDVDNHCCWDNVVSWFPNLWRVELVENDSPGGDDLINRMYVDFIQPSGFWYPEWDPVYVHYNHVDAWFFYRKMYL